MWFKLRLTWLRAYLEDREIKRVGSSFKANYWQINKEHVMRIFPMGDGN